MSETKQIKLRAGCRWHGKIEVPEFAEIKKDNKGRECYLSGTFVQNGIWYQQIKYIDNDEFYVGKFDLLNKFFERK